MCVLQHLLIHTRSATNQLSPDYIHDNQRKDHNLVVDGKNDCWDIDNLLVV